MMQTTGQMDIAKENELLPFEVLVMEPKRTLCEKIMSLVRFSYTENPLEDLKKKVRHIYDLHQLLQESDLADFFNSKNFEEMLLKVACDDIESYKNNNNWLVHHPNEAKIFAEIQSVWGAMKVIYNGDFKKLVYGNFPDDERIFETLMLIRNRLSAIEWKINIERGKG
jgi:hypothetical protein